MPLSAGYPVMLLVARKQLAHAGLFRNFRDQAVRLNAEVTSAAFALLEIVEVMRAWTSSSMGEKLRLDVFFVSLSTNAGDCESPELTAVSPQRTSTYVVIGVASQSVLPAYDSKDVRIVGR